jgi:hypothetical protein
MATTKSNRAQTKDGAKTKRSYNDRDLKLLWGRAAGRCAMPECRVELFAEATDYDPIVVIGEIAHVAAAGEAGPRVVPTMSVKERNSYDNLILLCRNCHGRIDGQPGFNTIEKLKDIKQAHEAWVRASLPERGRSRTGWTPIALKGGFPLDLATADAAVSPDYLSSTPHLIEVPLDTDQWQQVDMRIAAEVATLLGGADAFDRRVAVFPLAPVSACLALGYHFTSRPHLRLFQFHRDDRTWVWPRGPIPAQDLMVTGLEAPLLEARAVSFIFHLTAQVSDEVLREVNAPLEARVDFRIPNPSTAWLQHPEQLKWISQETRRAFERATQLYPNATDWHIFYSGPAPGAVAVGQQLNPTMYPQTQLYEFRAKESPRYKASIRLGGS